MVLFTLICSFGLILLGANELIKLAYQPPEAASKIIKENQEKINDINKVLSKKKELTSSYLQMKFDTTVFPPPVGDKKNLSNLPSDMQDLINRNVLLTEKSKLLENSQDLQKVKPRFSILNIWVWLWSVVIWTGVMIYKRIIESFADFVVEQIKKINGFLSTKRNQTS